MADDQPGGPSTTPEWTEFETPVKIVDAMEFWDAGTTYVCLSDAKERKMWLCVSTHDEDPIPDSTLFLNATHPDQMTARLPLSQAEATLVINSLENAVNAALAPQERESLAKIGDPAEVRMGELAGTPKHLHRSKEKWSAIYAFDALRRLRARESQAVLDAQKSNPPAWYAQYIAQRDENFAREEAERREHELFLSFYPAEVRQHFKLQRRSDDDFFRSNHEEWEEAQGKRLAAAVGDPVALAVMTSRAFGTLHENWNFSVGRDRIALHAIKTVSGEEFAEALEACKNDSSAMLGAARLFFLAGLGRRVPEAGRATWCFRLAEAVLESDLDDNKEYVLGIVSQFPVPEASHLLWRVAKGEVGKERKPSEFPRHEPSLQATAALILALRSDPDVKAQVESRLRDATGQDRTAYEVALAVLGDPTYIKNQNFETESYAVALGAIKAISQFNGTHGMDVLFDAGLEHPYGHVKSESLLAIQRLTGQAWFKDEEGQAQPGYYGDEAKAWWKANREAFLAKHAPGSDK